MHTVKYGLLLTLVFFLQWTALHAQQEMDLKTKNYCRYDGQDFKTGDMLVKEASTATLEELGLVLDQSEAKPEIALYAAEVPKVLGLWVDDQAVILYEEAFFSRFRKLTNGEWMVMGLLAHEVAHFELGHDIKKKNRKEEEWLADSLAGKWLFQLGATLEEAKLALRTHGNEEETSTHPEPLQRLIALERGYRAARKASDDERAKNPLCKRFVDAPSPDETIDNYVIYRDLLKAGQWDQAFELWKKVYAVAPAADGQRKTVMEDGVQFYHYYFTQRNDKSEKRSLIDTIFGIYDQIETCYPNGGGYTLARKGFDLYYKYAEFAKEGEAYDYLKRSIDMDGEKAWYFVVNPFTALLIDQYFNDKISLEEARTYERKIRDIIAYGTENCKGQECEGWEIIQEYSPARLEAFEAVKGFYDCDYYAEKYYPLYLEDSTNCELIRAVSSRLAWGGCSESDPKVSTLMVAKKNHCATPTTVLAREAYACLEQADYDCAIEKFEAAAEETSDVEKKGTFLLLVAKIYQVHKKNFPESRVYARKAAEVRPNWGEPYMHIGRLYASSGPLCGPGRGWASQIVTWPAIDMWNKAKQVDPSVASEANKFIRQYSQFMPKKEDVFQRLKKPGDRITVPCWIQKTTIIRTSD